VIGALLRWRKPRTSGAATGGSAGGGSELGGGAAEAAKSS
jgi:hypothetical protein